MTLHFALALCRLRPGLFPGEARAAPARAANDNRAVDSHDAMLHAALRQFAQHGIAASAHARQQAERAFFVGDRETYKWWLDICRMLDRKVAQPTPPKSGR